MKRSHTVLIYCVIYSIALYCLMNVSSVNEFDGKSRVGYISKVSPNTLLEDFQECYRSKLPFFTGPLDNFWMNYTYFAKNCDYATSVKHLDIRAVSNTDETKYIIYPKYNETLTMLTLGVGKDIDGEIELRRLYPNIDFYGADPVPENKPIYEKIGTFFPVAIGKNGGFRSSRVLKESYREEIALNVGLDYFLSEILRKKKIDIMWVDTEGSEFGMMEMLHLGEEVDKKGIVICQINVEYHLNIMQGITNEKITFRKFITRIVEDGKYIIVRPYTVPIVNYIRLVLINVSDAECKRLYITG